MMQSKVHGVNERNKNYVCDGKHPENMKVKRKSI